MYTDINAMFKSLTYQASLNLNSSSEIDIIYTIYTDNIVVFKSFLNHQCDNLEVPFQQKAGQDIEFHKVSHLVAFYGAHNCMKMLIDVKGESILDTKDSNNSTVIHALNWGCYQQVKEASVYRQLLETLNDCCSVDILKRTVRECDDYDYNGFELAVYLENYDIAMLLLESKGVYMQYHLYGNIIEKKYMLDEYICGSFSSRRHRSPVKMIISNECMNFIDKLSNSKFLNHPAIEIMINKWYHKIVLAYVSLLWLLVWLLLYIPPFNFDINFMPFENSNPFDCSVTTKINRVLSYHSAVMIHLANTEQRINTFLNLTFDEFKLYVPDNLTASSYFEFNDFFKTKDLFKYFPYGFLKIFCLAFSVGYILYRTGKFCYQFVVTVNRLRKVKYRSCRFYKLYNRQVDNSDTLLMIAVIAWCFHSLIPFFYSPQSDECHDTRIFKLIASSVLVGENTNETQYNEIMTSLAITHKKIISIVVILAHNSMVLIHILIVYGLEGLPMVGELLMLFRQVLRKFLPLMIILAISIVTFASLFEAEKSYLCHSTKFNRSTIESSLCNGHLNTDAISGYFHQFYNTFLVSLNMKDPIASENIDKKALNEKSGEIAVLHVTFIFFYGILVLNFLIASLVSLIDHYSKHKQLIHQLDKLSLVMAIENNIVHPIRYLFRLMLCRQDELSIDISSVVSKKNKIQF